MGKDISIYDLNWVGTLREMSDHSLMILSGESEAAEFLLTSLDEQGNFRWQKKYSVDKSGEAFFTDLVEKNGSRLDSRKLYPDRRSQFKFVEFCSDAFQSGPGNRQPAMV